MTLQQMSAVRHWHIDHHRQRTVEFQLWDAMLTCWLLGWIGLAPAIVLAQRLALPACALLYFAPSLYVWLRGKLHRSGVLRCDWLSSLRV